MLSRIVHDGVTAHAERDYERRQCATGHHADRRIRSTPPQCPYRDGQEDCAIGESESEVRDERQPDSGRGQGGGCGHGPTACPSMPNGNRKRQQKKCVGQGVTPGRGEEIQNKWVVDHADKRCELQDEPACKYPAEKIGNGNEQRRTQ